MKKCSFIWFSEILVMENISVYLGIKEVAGYKSLLIWSTKIDHAGEGAGYQG